MSVRWSEDSRTGPVELPENPGLYLTKSTVDKVDISVHLSIRFKQLTYFFLFIYIWDYNNVIVGYRVTKQWNNEVDY